MLPQPFVRFLIPTCALALASCNGEGGPPQSPGSTGARTETPLVRTEAVQIQKVRREIEATTYLQAEHRVAVMSKVAGRIASVKVDDGAKVSVGQILAELDAAEARLGLQQLDLQVEERKIRLQLARLQVDVSGRTVEQARIELDRTSADYQRNAKMEAGLVSQKQLQESDFAFRKSKESLQVAEFDQRKSKLDVDAIDQQIRELQARRAEKDLVVKDHTIRAPLDGVVAKVHVRGGETVVGNTPLFDVLDPGRLIAYLKRPQIELPLLRQARQVLFTTDAFGNREFEAQIDLVSPVVDNATGSFDIRMRIKKVDTNVLVPGMFLRCRILAEDQRDAVMVPKTAVLADGDRSILFVVRNGRAVRLELETGLETNTHIECRNRAGATNGAGLRDHDPIVISGQAHLRDGEPVDVAPAATAQPK